jgi:hypothetical protein
MRRKPADPLLAQHLVERQQPLQAALAGALAAFAGAMVWAIVGLAQFFTVQLTALGIGALCGIAVGRAGKIVERRYARISIYCCIAACLAGEMIIAYAMRLSLALLWSGTSLALLAVFALAGSGIAYACTFAWLSPEQRQALRDARLASARGAAPSEPADSPGRPRES